MTGVPSNLIPLTILQLPEESSPIPEGYLLYAGNGRTWKVSIANALDAGGSVPSTRQIIAGDGLSGGGTLAADVTLNVIFADTLPLTGDLVGSAGTADVASRSDHRHPAVNLDDNDETTGTLAIARGGTNASTEAGARMNLGATTVGAALFMLTDPGAITFLQVNADSTVTALSDADFRTALSLGTAALKNTGTSGDAVPLLNALNVHTSMRNSIASTSGTEIDWATGDFHTRAITTPTVFTFANVASGAALGIIVQITMTGSQAITWPASVQWPGGSVAPTLASDKVHLFTFISTDGGTVVHASSLIDYTS